MDLTLTYTPIQKFLLLFASIFILLFTISFSFPHEIIPDPGAWTNKFFEALSTWFADNILHIKKPYIHELISDSTGFYVNALVLLIISILISSLLIFFKRKINYPRLQYWLIVFCRYYLAMQLLAYAFGKIFKTQFYLPEPNTLFTTMGNTPRDLLYWSVMGTSKAYNIFMGSLELIAGSLLLFRRTTVLGGLLSAGILINVIAINLTYDISVKLYSIFLFFLSVVILWPHLRFLYAFFISGKTNAANISFSERKKKWIHFTKAGIILLLFIDAILPYAKSGNFNDDNSPRPEFHGAYEVKTFNIDLQSVPPSLENTSRWKRVFIHRQGYFIIEFMNDEMKDMMLKVDETNRQFLLTDYDSSKIVLNYNDDARGLYMLAGALGEKELRVSLEKIDLEKLPLMRREFHWTIDEINQGNK